MHEIFFYPTRLEFILTVVKALYMPTAVTSGGLTGSNSLINPYVLHTAMDTFHFRPTLMKHTDKTCLLQMFPLCKSLTSSVCLHVSLSVGVHTPANNSNGAAPSGPSHMGQTFQPVRE